MFMYIIQPCEVARRSSREYLRTGLLVESRNIVGIKEEITILIFFLTSACAFFPFVILRCVVHNEIKADINASFVTFGC